MTFRKEAKTNHNSACMYGCTAQRRMATQRKYPTAIRPPNVVVPLFRALLSTLSLLRWYVPCPSQAADAGWDRKPAAPKATSRTDPSPPAHTRPAWPRPSATTFNTPHHGARTTPHPNLALTARVTKRQPSSPYPPPPAQEEPASQLRRLPLHCPSTHCTARPEPNVASPAASYPIHLLTPLAQPQPQPRKHRGIVYALPHHTQNTSIDDPTWSHVETNSATRPLIHKPLPQECVPPQPPPSAGSPHTLAPYHTGTPPSGPAPYHSPSSRSKPSLALPCHVLKTQPSVASVPQLQPQPPEHREAVNALPQQPKRVPPKHHRLRRNPAGVHVPRGRHLPLRNVRS